MNEKDTLYAEGEEDFYDEEIIEDGEIAGVTDTVVSYTFTGMEFPCVIFKDDVVFPEHKMLVLSKMLKMGAPDKDISIYFMKEGELYRIGKLSGMQMKAFLQIVGEDSVRVFYAEGHELLGDKIYVLCSN